LLLRTDLALDELLGFLLLLLGIGKRLMGRARGCETSGKSLFVSLDRQKFLFA
jgi:hypothetical protein